MGASNSQEMEPGTPNPETRHVLPVDPRSPSTFITRTPIIVEKTPEGALDVRPREGLAVGTPSIGDVMVQDKDEPLDPRSPTRGIARTPLTYIMGPGREQETENITKTVPKLDLSQTDLEISPDMDVDTENVSTSALLGMTDIQNLSIDDFPISESTRLVPREPEVVPAPVEAAKPQVRKKKQKASQAPKELFPNKKHTALKDSTRSPLANRNVDMNSPLQIVQRKQLRDIDLKRNCAQESTRSRFVVKDKENM